MLTLWILIEQKLLPVSPCGIGNHLIHAGEAHLEKLLRIANRQPQIEGDGAGDVGGFAGYDVVLHVDVPTDNKKRSSPSAGIV